MGWEVGSQSTVCELLARKIVGMSRGRDTTRMAGGWQMAGCLRSRGKIEWDSKKVDRYRALMCATSAATMRRRRR